LTWMKKENKNSDDSGLMRHRKIMLEDGRYMIFYTFAKSLSRPPVINKQDPKAASGPEAPENKNV